MRTGDDFYGFKVERSEDTPISHIYVFSKRGKFIQLEMTKEDYISLILDDTRRLDITDAMQKHLYEEYGGKFGDLEGMWGGI